MFEKMKLLKLWLLTAALSVFTLGAWGDSVNFFADSNDANTWHVANAAGLTEFATAVNGGTAYAGQTVVLDADIEIVLDGGANWTPIGTDANPFKGTFNGNNHTISGLSIISLDGGSINGLFGVVEGAVISDLIVNGSLSGVGDYSAVVVGKAKGIAMTNVTARGSLSGNGDYTGGVIGRTCEGYNAAIVSCTNEASVTVDVDNKKIGGIVGQVKGKDGYTCFVENCVNKGAITGSIVGGITGYGTFASIIGCVNEGAIKEVASSGYVQDVNGGVDARGAGGIVAAMASVNATGLYCVSNCYNKGTVSGLFKAAGIVANLLSQGTYACRCVNVGAVTSSNLAGGINCCCCGTSAGVIQCVNIGAVTSTGTVAESALAAGIMGEVYGAGNHGSISACYNQGVITSANGSTSPFRTSGSPAAVCYTRGTDGFVDSATPANAVTATTIATALGDIATATSDNEFTVTVAGQTVSCKGVEPTAVVITRDNATVGRYDTIAAALDAYNFSNNLQTAGTYVMTITGGVETATIYEVDNAEIRQSTTKIFTIKPVDGQKVTLKFPASSAYSYKRVFNIYGGSTYSTENVIFDGLAFDLSAGAEAIHFLGEESSDQYSKDRGYGTYGRYSSYVTVKNCSFAGGGDGSVAIASPSGCSPSAIVVTNCVCTDVGYLVSAYAANNAGFGFKVFDCHATNCKAFFNQTGNDGTIEIRNCTAINHHDYCVRVNSATTISGCAFTNDCPSLEDNATEGAILVIRNGTPAVTVENTTFTDLSAEGITIHDVQNKNSSATTITANGTIDDIEYYGDAISVAKGFYEFGEVERVVEVTPQTVQDTLDSVKGGYTIVLTAGDYGSLYLRNNGTDATRVLKNVTIKAQEGAAVTVEQIAYEQKSGKYLDVENLTIDGITFDNPQLSGVYFDCSGAGCLRVNGLLVKNCTKVGDNSSGGDYGKYTFISLQYDSENPPTTFAGDTSLECGYHNIQIVSNAITKVYMPIAAQNGGMVDGLTVVSNVFTDCTDNHIQKSGNLAKGTYLIADNTIINMTGRFARISGAQADTAVIVRNNTIITPLKYDTGNDGSIFKVTGEAGFTVTSENNTWETGSYSADNTTWVAQGILALLPAAKVTHGDVVTVYYTLQEAFDAVQAGDTLDVLANNTETITITNTCAFTFNSNGYTLGDAPKVPTGYAFRNEDGVCYYGETIATIGAAPYFTLASAIAAVKDGETIKVLKSGNVVTEYTKAIGEDGYSEAAGYNRLICGTASKFILDLNGKELTGRINFTQGDMTISNGTIRADTQAVNIYGSMAYTEDPYTTVTLAADATLRGNFGFAIFGGNPNKTYWPLGFGEIVNVYGKIYASSNPIQVSGNVGNANYTENIAAQDGVESIVTAKGKSINELMRDFGPRVNIYDGAVLARAEGISTEASPQALALLGQGTANIYGGTLTGSEAVGMKGGCLNVYGGTLVAVGPKCNPIEVVHSGTESSGAAISASTYYNGNYPIVINVQGGYMSSVSNAALVVAHSYKGETPVPIVKGISVTIAGGTFIGGADQQAVLVEDALDSDPVGLWPMAFAYPQMEGSAETGYPLFSSNIDSDYAAVGFKVKDNGNGTWTVTAGTAEIKTAVDEDLTPTVETNSVTEITEDEKKAISNDVAEITQNIIITVTDPDNADLVGTGVDAAMTTTNETGAAVMRDYVYAAFTNAVPEADRSCIDSNSTVTSYVKLELKDIVVTVETNTSMSTTEARVLESTLTRVKYDVTPEVTTEYVTGNVTNTVKTTIPEGTILASPVTFRLWLEESFVGTVAHVQHLHGETEVEDPKDYIVQRDENGKKFIELSWNQFSIALIDALEVTGKACWAGNDKTAGALYETVAAALAAAQAAGNPAGFEIYLLQDCAETGLALEADTQTINLNGYNFTGSITEVAGTEQVTTKNGLVYRSATAVNVRPVAGNENTLPIRGYPEFPAEVTTDADKQAYLEALNENGVPRWQAYVTGVDFKLLPQIVGAATGFSQVMIRAQESFTVNTPERCGVAVSFNLLKKDAGEAAFTQYITNSLSPSFAVDVKAINDKTYWKIQTVFDSTEMQ